MCEEELFLNHPSICFLGFRSTLVLVRQLLMPENLNISSSTFGSPPTISFE